MRMPTVSRSSIFYRRPPLRTALTSNASNRLGRHSRLHLCWPDMTFWRASVPGHRRCLQACDRETGEVVALKVLKQGMADQARLMERFKNELRLARKITHRNVCRINDFTRTEDTAFISMEFVEGESLRGCCTASERSIQEKPWAWPRKSATACVRLTRKASYIATSNLRISCSTVGRREA